MEGPSSDVVRDSDREGGEGVADREGDDGIPDREGDGGIPDRDGGDSVADRAGGATAPRPGSILSGGRVFDWVMVGLSTWWVVGISVDGRSHAHDAPESVLTVEHAVFYAAFLAILAWLLAAAYRNRDRGSVRAALPRGYWLSFLGAVAFAVGGVGDLAWHAAFGIEAGIEALLSPTHLLLAGGGALMASGPLRAAWYRRTPRTWRAQAPMVLSATILLAVLTFVTMFLHPFVFARSLVPGGPDSLVVQAGIAAVLVHTALVMAVALAMVWRFRPVFGAFAVLIGGNALAAAPLGNSYPLVPVAVVAGLVADLLHLRLRPSPDRIRAFRAFALAVPLVLYGLYFLAIEYAVGIAWSVHFWTGAVALAGIVGLGMSYLVVLPEPGVEGDPR